MVPNVGFTGYLQGLQNNDPKALAFRASLVAQEAKRAIPGTGAAAAFQGYINEHYGGKVPPGLQDVATSLSRGYGHNDNMISSALKADIGLRNKAAQAGKPQPRPLSAISPHIGPAVSQNQLGGNKFSGMLMSPQTAAYNSTDIIPTGYRASDKIQTINVMNGLPKEFARADIQAHAEDQKEHFDSLKQGLLGNILGGVVGLGAGLVNPAAGAAWAIASQGANNLPKSLATYGAGKFLGAVGDPLLSKATNALSSGGFSNPSALGLNPSSLYQPASLPSAGNAAVRGFEGLAGGSLYSPAAFQGAYAGNDFIPQPGLEGLNPSSLYQPQSLAYSGSLNPSGSSINALKSLGGGGGATGGAAALGGADAFSTQGGSIAPLTGGFGSSGNSVTDRFNYALTDALTGQAGNTTNALAQGNMGPGKIMPTQRDMVQNPGYQPRPFANFLMRG